MDSRAYAAGITELRNNLQVRTDTVPFVFAARDIAVSDEAWQAALLFFTIVSSAEQDHRLRIRHYNNPLCRALNQVHGAIRRALEAKAHDAQSVSLLSKLLTGVLVNAIHPARPTLIPDPDPLSHAVLCCLLEALMHFGWCPNATENVVKRAAHASFAHLRKSLFHAEADERALILSYLWCAWLFAQKTEGIREAKLPVEKGAVAHHACLDIDGNRYNLHVVNYTRPAFFALYAWSETQPPYAFDTLYHNRPTGLTIYGNDSPLAQIGDIMIEEISRPGISGLKFRLNRGGADAPLLHHTIVLQVYASTLYRIDALAPVDEELELSRAAYCAHFERQFVYEEDNFYICTGLRTKIFKFLQNPWGFCFNFNPATGQAVAESSAIRLVAPVQIVTAWAKASGIGDINACRLTGIFE
ncbi:MAG: hypothetical protein GF398_16330 [Chitinivibrionales bacterium]|nr:hypothetical protein [Chitinivibrionales bacterium]